MVRSVGTSCGLGREPWGSHGNGLAITLHLPAGHRPECIWAPDAVDIPQPCLTPLHSRPPMRQGMTITRLMVTVIANAHWKLS